MLVDVAIGGWSPAILLDHLYVQGVEAHMDRSSSISRYCIGRRIVASITQNKKDAAQPTVLQYAVTLALLAASTNGITYIVDCILTDGRACFQMSAIME